MSENESVFPKFTLRQQEIADELRKSSYADYCLAGLDLETRGNTVVIPERCVHSICQSMVTYGKARFGKSLDPLEWVILELGNTSKETNWVQAFKNKVAYAVEGISLRQFEMAWKDDLGNLERQLHKALVENRYADLDLLTEKFHANKIRYEKYFGKSFAEGEVD